MKLYLYALITSSWRLPGGGRDEWLQRLITQSLLIETDNRVRFSHSMQQFDLHRRKKSSRCEKLCLLRWVISRKWAYVKRGLDNIDSVESDTNRTDTMNCWTVRFYLEKAKINTVETLDNTKLTVWITRRLSIRSRTAIELLWLTPLPQHRYQT